MKVRLILGAALAAVLALGVTSAGFSAGHHRTPNITGMVGGDFDTQLPPGGRTVRTGASTRRSRGPRAT